jgi:nucleotide-binding universal stress UspA family protein
MSIDRIVVGYDGYQQSRGALAWAAREASETGAVVHVVTAWTASSDRPPEVAAMTGRLRDRQAEAIRAAIAGLSRPRRPVVTGSVIMADAVTALARAAQEADLVVIGSGTHVADRLNARLRRWPRRYGGPCPVRVVRTLSTSDIRLQIRDLGRIPQLASQR